MLELSTYIYPGPWEFVKSQVVREDGDILPVELILKTFEFLGLQHLADASRVCKRWNVLAEDNAIWKTFDLERLFPLLHIPDKTIWQTQVGLSVKDAKALDMRTTIQSLKKMFNDFKTEKDSSKGITLLTLPKGLSSTALATLIASHKKLSAIVLKYAWGSYEGSSVPNEVQDTVDETHTIAITNFTLENTGRLTVENQDKYLQSRGYEMPTTLHFVTGIVFKYLQKEHLSMRDFLGYEYFRFKDRITDCSAVLCKKDYGNALSMKIFYTNCHPHPCLQIGTAAMLKL